MEGLEIVEIKIKDIIADNEEFRIDAGYYKKDYIELYNMLSNGQCIGELTTMSDVSSNGCFKFVQDTLKEGAEKTIPYIRSGNVGDTFINANDLTHISKESHCKLPLSATKLYDVMMARKGKIGGASIITEDEVNYNCNENVIKLSISDKVLINPLYFTVFFNSKYGTKQVERLSTGNVQPWVSIFQIRKLKLIILSKIFQASVANIVQKCFRLHKNSFTYYSKAETLLLDTLNLTGWQPTKDTTTEKSFADFLQSGRLDAEYYQPKYDELFEHLSKYETKRLGKIAVISKSIEPGSDAYQSEGVPFIRVSNLSKYGLSQPDIYLDALEFGADEVIRPRKDTILLSKDGSVGIAYKVQEDMNSITSGAILHLNLRNDEFLPDYVTLVLNSIIVKMQAERDAGGSIIQHWKPSEIEQVIIPKLSMAKQREITAKIQESFALRAESKRLLDLAKRAVEVAIEQGEDEGLKLLK